MRTLHEVTLSRFLLIGLLLTFVAVPRTLAQTGGTTPAVEIIVARMAKARAENQARLRPYVVTRLYTLFGKERDKTKSEVTAEVAFAPPNSKKFTITERTGSGLGERIVRRMLEGETQIVKDYHATDISPANYDFRFGGEEDMMGQRCYVVALFPKRQDKTLLRGNMWVDANTYLLRRLEVAPAKGPSWWLRDVRIAFAYGDVSGMWLQTSSEFTTNVRIFGEHTIISRDVSYAGAELAGPARPEPRTPLPPYNQEEQRCAAPCGPVSSKEIQAVGRECPDRTK